MLCRYTTAKLGKNEIYLAYTVQAMFMLGDMLQEGEEIMGLLDGKDIDSLTRFCKAINILAMCGAQAREAEGFPRSYIPQDKELIVCMQPIEYITIKREAINAILLGYGREIIDPEEEIDLELAEIEKK